MNEHQDDNRVEWALTFQQHSGEIQLANLAELPLLASAFGLQFAQARGVACVRGHARCWC